MACAIRVLSTCFMRPGSDEYARRHRHYGLTTIRDGTHGEGRPGHLRLPGKSASGSTGHPRPERGPHRARNEEASGKEVFKFLADDGAVVDVRREHLNDYIKGVMGPRLHGKDFRTWAGTLICACALARIAENAPSSSRRSRRRKRQEVREKVVEAVKETAAELGNTPAVSRTATSSRAWSALREGRGLEKYFDKVEELVEHDKPALPSRRRR
jgi:DNA topoisomerase-1